jgi:uncharacterized protein (TIGR02300 family)
MTKPEWGSKRICLNCGTRFYDMQRSPIVCPKCGSENAPDAVTKVRRTVKKAAPHPVAEPKPKVEATVDEDEATVDADETDEADAALIEDASDLAEDDDMAEVMDHLGTADEE